MLLFLWYFGHLAFITIDGLSDEGKTADVAVILGSKVNEDGTFFCLKNKKAADFSTA